MAIKVLRVTTIKLFEEVARPNKKINNKKNKNTNKMSRDMGSVPGQKQRHLANLGIYTSPLDL